MIAFWVMTGVLAGLAGLAVLARAARPGPVGDGGAMARRLYSEIDALVDRGVMEADQAQTARAEAGRRLLAQAAGEAPEASSGRQRAAVTFAAAAAGLLGLGLYAATGSPGLVDRPFAARLQDWQGRLETLGPAEMAEVAQSVADQRPDQAQAWAFLGRARAQSDQPLLAAQAFRRSLALDADQPDIWAYMGEALVRVADGQVGPDARAAFGQALARDPTQAAARYHLGLAAVQDGDREAALAAWRALAADLPVGEARREDLMAQIANLEAGRPYDAPAPLDSETRAMAEGMVARLAARLEAEPQDAEGWVRLVAAYGVLGDTAAQAGALERARILFADRADVLMALDEAAR